MTDNFKNETHHFLTPIHENTEANNEFFTINSQKAAEILGVNRTRLSQLTSQGIFPYERRKVESRSRLFYRLNDLLNYQRKSSFGNVVAREDNRQTKALVPITSPLAPNLQNVTPVVTSQIRHVSFKRPTIKPPRVLQKARDLKIEQEERNKNEKIRATVANLESQMQKIMHAMNNLEIALSKIRKSYSNHKKIMFDSPRVKRLFKRIKR